GIRLPLHQSHRETVVALAADRLDGGAFETGIAPHEFDEALYAQYLGIRGRTVEHLALPDDVVGNNHCSWPGKSERPFEVLRQTSSIRVHKDEIVGRRFDLDEVLQ